MDINRYLILPTSKNLGRPKFMGYLEAVLEHMVALGVAGESIGSAFDVQNAAGSQLDVIGELVGLPRLLPYLPATGTREMDDDEYRLALMMKIARNEWDGTNESAVEIIRNYAAGEMSISFVDNQDSTVDYSITGTDSTRLIEIFNAANLLLVPSGVSSTIVSELGDVTTTVYVGAGLTGIDLSDTVNMAEEG